MQSKMFQKSLGVRYADFLKYDLSAADSNGCYAVFGIFVGRMLYFSNTYLTFVLQHVHE